MSRGYERSWYGTAPLCDGLVQWSSALVSHGDVSRSVGMVVLGSVKRRYCVLLLNDVMVTQRWVQLG